jgi:hypothetical protein
MLALPRNSSLLCSLWMRSGAKLHALLQADPSRLARTHHTVLARARSPHPARRTPRSAPFSSHIWQALLFFSLSFIIATLGVLPIPFVVVLLLVSSLDLT